MIFFETDKYRVQFTGRDTGEDQLSAIYKNLYSLKQTHSDHLVEASSQLQEGDAQWTTKIGIPLMIQTADCIPLMMYFPERDLILSIHAGWRGVMTHITSKAIVQLSLQNETHVHAYIGPHIQFQSFEVDEDVAIKILAAHQHTLSSPHCKKIGNKYFIALAKLVEHEIRDSVNGLEQFIISSIDTKTDHRFYSYRNGDRGGRNLSFIVKRNC
ncbi:MAG: polyphenol oxidase family protein [Bdellovibrionaceae bacterium]|nr:polyphenol oxidase family protein [Pseudobdellovibrionaceae bacterium]